MARELRDICKSFAEEVEAAYYSEDGLYDYLSENSYDIEMRVGTNKDLRSVQIMLAGGGPSIFLDTRERGIVGYWGGIEAIIVCLKKSVTLLSRILQRYTGLICNLCETSPRVSRG